MAAAKGAQAGPVEAPEGSLVLDLGAVPDAIESTFYKLTEVQAMTDQTTAERNIEAFLVMIGKAEGTYGRGGYACVCGYGHTIQDFSDHPKITGEWTGIKLSDQMCANAGFGPGCVSTAAGMFQIIAPTWREFGGRAKFGAFDEAGQKACTVAIIASHGALEDVKAGRLMSAAFKVRNRWASLPGNKAKQGQRTPAELTAYFTQAGGTLA
jgi:muramidase (phage lysozyme)